MMLKIFALKLYAKINCALLIMIIFSRLPRVSLGITGSTRSGERLLNILTALGILFYFGIALQQNLILGGK
jgi:hypothetical protein